jgi:hypothetical protein
MDTERIERARFAAEVRRRGTILSNEAITDLCEALLEILDGGSISLELHRELLDKVRSTLDYQSGPSWDTHRERVTELERERDEAQHRYERALEALAESSAAAAREQARLREALEVVIIEGDCVRDSSPECFMLRHHMRVAWLAAKRAVAPEVKPSVELALEKVYGFDANGSPVAEAGAPRGPELDDVIRDGGRD